MENKETIVVAEMLYPKGHLTLNRRYIEVLSSVYNVVVIDDGKYFSHINLPDTVQIIKVISWKPSVDRFYKLKRLFPFIKYDPIDFFAHLFNLIVISTRLMFYNYRKIIFMSVRNDVISFGRFLFRRDSIIAFHHYDIDYLQSHPRQIPLFKQGMNRMDHIVLADFIKKGWLNQFQLNPNRVHVVHQPLVDKTDYHSFLNIKRKPIVISLGLTIDEEILSSIISIDKNNRRKLPYQIIIRHRSIEYVGNNVNVITGYFDRSVYDNYLKTASACLVLYPQSYKLRYSGVIDDALGHAMNVYGNNIDVMRYFADKYPNSCKVLNSIDDLFNLSISEEGINREDFSAFVSYHSDSAILKQFSSIINSKASQK